MLEELNIENIALIEKAQLKFCKGFNVLTGETGAGKSILLGALGLLLGDKSDKSLLRRGASEAVVSGILHIEITPEIEQWMEKYDISIPHGELIIRRNLKDNGRSSVYIQSQAVNLSALKELSSLLFDIHGQHQHQSLFHLENHRKLLDRYGGLEEKVRNFTRQFKEAAALREELQQWDQNQQDQKRERELAEYAYREIEGAKLIPGEDVELMEKLKLMEKQKDLVQKYNQYYQTMLAQGGILSKLKDLQPLCSDLSILDQQGSSVEQRFENAYYELEDTSQTIQQWMEDFSFSPEEQVQIEERLALIHKLQNKYHPTLEGLIDHMSSCKAILDSDQESQHLWEEKKSRSIEMDQKVLEDAKAISQARSLVVKDLEVLATNHLHDLGMESAQFKISLQGRTNSTGKNSCGPFGMDEVEFLLSANRGEELQPLKKVASGGELSRIMLAIKSVLAEVDQVGTLVFDEIDTGIGGQVALSIGQHIQKLSKGKQIFSITHLASIASFADNHFRVVKEEQDGRTITKVDLLDDLQRVSEVSRMLAGDSANELSLSHARELLELNSPQAG